MKFEIKTNKLNEALYIVESALPDKTVLESLKGIKIDAYKDRIIFSTTKQDISIQYTINIDFEVEREGTTIIPGNYLIKICRKTTEESISFTSDSNVTKLKTKNSKIDLIQYELNSYPEILFDTIDGKNIDIYRETLLNAFNQTKNSVSTDTSSPIITGINLTINNGEIKVASTDARRLAISTFIDECRNDDIKFTVHKNNFSQILKVTQVLEEDKIPFIISKNQIVINTDSLKLKARLIEGDYPEIERLIPNEINYSYEVKNSELKRTIDKILLLSEHENANVKAKVENDTLILESQFRELGAIEEKCPIQNLNGNPFLICYDPRFLNDALNSIKAENIELKFVDEVSAFVIKEVDKNDNIHIISPYRTT